MDYLLISDVHGECERMKEVYGKYADLDGHLLLGDVGFEDPILNRFSIINGNHDQHRYPEKRIFRLQELWTLMIHGHYFEYVVVEQMKKQPHLWKSWDECMNLLYDEIARYAKVQGFDMVLFGHTHTAFFEQRDGIYLCNPGSLCFSHDGRPPSYAILSVAHANASVQFHYLKED